LIRYHVIKVLGDWCERILYGLCGHQRYASLGMTYTSVMCFFDWVDV